MGILGNESNLFKECLHILTTIIIIAGILVLTLPKTALQKPLSPALSHFRYNSIRQKYLFKKEDSIRKGLKGASEFSPMILGYLTSPLTNLCWESPLDLGELFHHTFFPVLPHHRSPPIFI